jgi:hypothetical protein
MVRGGAELFIGLQWNPQFGPVIAFGLGGIFTEILSDVTFRLLPITAQDAAEMLTEVRARKVFEGYRGGDPLSREVLVDLLVRAGRMGMALAGRLGSIDLNPIVVLGKEHRVLDMLAKTGEIDWNRVHASTVNALRRKGLVDSRRDLTDAGKAARAAVPNIFDDLFDRKEAAMPQTQKTTNHDAFRQIDRVEITLHDPIRERFDEGSTRRGMRLYRTASPLTHGEENARWSLQVRAQVKTKAGVLGKHFAIGTASVSRDDLVWLRAQINAELRRKS